MEQKKVSGADVHTPHGSNTVYRVIFSRGGSNLSQEVGEDFDRRQQKRGGGKKKRIKTVGAHVSLRKAGRHDIMGGKTR